MATVSTGGISFGGVNFTATSITVDSGQEPNLISGGHLGLGVDDFEPLYEQVYKSQNEFPTVSVEYIGGTRIDVGAEGALSVTGAGLEISSDGNATCISSRVSASVGELVRGSASFRLRPAS